MKRTDEFRELFAYNRWANQAILDAAASLTDEQFARDLGSSFPSVRDTLVHVMSAEWVWLSRWRGISPTAMPESWKRLDLAGLREQWVELDAALRAFVDALSEPDLDARVAYRNLAGDPFSEPLAQLLRHVVNHSTYHRGQVTTMLRQLGAQPPATDLVRFYRATAPTISAG